MIFCSTHTRNKCGMDIGVILSVFLSVCAWQAYGQEKQTLGNLTFVCKEGWKIYQSDCYMRVDVMMIWDDAKSTCQRQGGDLLWIVNEIEYDFVKADVTTGGMFWSGLQHESGIAKWSHMTGSVDLKDIAVWANSEPNTDGSNARCAVSQDEGLALKSCSLKLPFICKYQGCLKGYMPCATGGNCFSQNQKCDGVNDCSDRSDERDCRQTERCSYYYKLTGTSGNFQTARIDDGTHCSYVLEAPVGKRIRLNVPSTTLDEDTASLEIWTGSPDLQHSKRIARLTGAFAQNYYFSMNNFITVLLITGNMPTSARPAIAISYALDIDEIFDDVRTVSAFSSWMPLSPTFSKEETPMELKLSWKIEAPEGEVIMYYLDSYIQSEGASVTVQEGAMADDPVRTMDPASVNRVYYGSAASTLQVHWNSGEGMSTFSLQYKTGCNMEIDKAVGAFSVPIFWKPSERYPSDLTCEWALTGGKVMGRGLTVEFILIQLGEDPRAITFSQDKIKLYMNESTDSTEIGNAQSGLRFHDDSGHIKVEFLSDLILNDGVGFVAKFSVDCPRLDVSDWTVKSDESLTYETDVMFSCQTGYKFDAQEYYNMPEVTLHCMEGGVWTYNGKTDIRVPNCEVVQCGIPDEIQNGYIKNVSSTSHDGTAYYQCNDGFGISYPNNPDTHVYCDASGSWQNVPSCSSATCLASEIQGISHGTYEVEAGNEITSAFVDFATVIKFSCDPGYELVGSLRSHCRTEGWSDSRPTCQILQCPKLMRDNAEASADPIDYGQSDEISCLSGYSINGTVTQTSVIVTCDSDRNLMPYFECEDINECEEGHSCDVGSTECSNTDGDYDCLCLDGYQNIGAQRSCSDIRECDTNNGGCSDTCQELPGSYQCTCPTGWTLFTVDGTEQHYIPPLENGYRYGDIYYYNHTCVRNACARPEDVDHGTLLSTKTLFHYEDTVDLVCDDGYYLTGYAQTTTRLTRACLSTGWNVEIITCSARTCSTPAAPNRGGYDKTTVPFGEKVTLTCQWTATETRTRTAVCIYEGGGTRLAGDDITSCPEIDCGNPANSLPSGGIVVNYITASNKHLDNGAFTFGCDAGFTSQGKSESNNTTVRCKENGRWSLGTLDCAGQKCSDPGTPAEAEQVVDNYEVGKTLYFTCNRNGYEPEPDLVYTCQYNSFTDSTSWSNNLASNFPACLDRTAPEILNLPAEPVVYRDRMKMANVNAPVFEDNFAVRQTVASNSIQSTDIIARSMTVTYTATDFDGNEKTAAVNIQVIDRTNKPSLNCPHYLELPVTNVSPETYDITQDVNSDDANTTMTFSQETVTVSVGNIGTYVQIDVTAKNEFDTEAYCSFMVTFRAVVCFESTLYPDSNAIRSCAASGDGFVCTSVCRSGYIYGDGMAEKQFTCTGQNVWNINYPHVFCLPVQSPTYQFDATVIHDYNFLSGPCLSDYQRIIQNNLNQFKSRMTALHECAGVQWDISSYTADIGAASTQFKTDFTVATTAISEAAQTSCVQAIKTNNEVVFNIGSSLFCQSQDSSYAISISDFTSTDGSFGCNTPTYVLIEPAEGKKCVPCGPGQFYYEAGDSCTSCPDGQYQDQSDGTCKECNAGETPNTEKTDCIITCPAGFTSGDGLLPCSPCAVNYYWSDATTCTPCNSGTSTSGREGVGAVAGCYSSCLAGQYSLTGYIDAGCMSCPRNFYQHNVGSTTCLECPVDEVTDNTGQTELASCHDYIFSGGEACNNAYCNNHGTCGFQFHRPVCTCDGGYRGDRCQTAFHICDSSPYNPCMNGATCIPGSVFDVFTCECSEVLNIDSCFTESFPNKDGGNSNQIQQYSAQTLAYCQTQCLERENCESLTYYTLGGQTICVLYSVTLAEGQLIDIAGRTYYNRNCPPVYDGPKCENDVFNECDNPNNQCSSAAMCKDKVLDYECLCPTIGGYQGQYCEQTQQPCDSFPCQHGGSCVNFGNIRYECTCVLGYTGVNCETNIDDCAIHSDACSYGGSCNDRVDGYTCVCPTSFSGDNCEVTPDYCAFTNCLGNPCYNNLDGRTSMCECESPYFEDSGLGDNRCNSTGAHECDYVSCVNGTCNNQGNCVCEAGFTGSLCQHSIDDCTANSCVNGNCVDLHQGVECECHPGFAGDRCETNINDCADQCGANGRCEDGIDGFTCVCNSGYTGSNCETDINECSAYPCLHDGTCEDLVGTYRCSCPAGWTGNNCERWNDFCTPNPCRNDGECYNLKQDLICRCGGGTQGQFCDDRRSVCETVQHVNVCINGGECQDTGGTAECQCPVVPDMDRCFTTVHTDKEGGSERLISQTFVDEQSCKQTCLGRSDCKSLSYFTIGNSRVCQIYNITLPTTLTDRPGALHFVKECPSDYAGEACELAKDWCAGSPCQHGGTCTALEPRGFHCDCETGYSGTTCEIAANPCSANPCPSEATCRHSETEYYCQCPMGREVTGGLCRSDTSGAGYLILVADAADAGVMRRKRDSHGGNTPAPLLEDLPTLRSPFRMSGGTLSVMLWVRIHNPLEDYTYELLKLVGSEMLFPWRDGDPKLIVLITNKNAVLTYNDESVTLNFDPPLKRAKWYHIGVSLTADRQASYTINAVEVSDPQTLPGDAALEFDNLNAQIVLGHVDMVVEYKRVTVWETALSNSEFSQAYASEVYTPQGTITQGWWNYLLTKSARLLTQELPEVLYSVDRSLPTLTCDSTPYERVSNERILRRSSLMDFTSRINGIYANGDKLLHSVPEDLTWGYYSAVVIYEANNRYIGCKFPVYIKYNDVCPAPVDDSDVTITRCDDGSNDGVCGLQCTNSALHVSSSRPKYRPCSVLGVYYWDAPHKDLVLPTCAVVSPQKFVVSIEMQYEFSINCALININDIKDGIKEKFVELNSRWTNICIGGSDCTNLKFTKSVCSSVMTKRLDVGFSLNFQQERLYTLDMAGNADGDMRLDDALKSIIVLQQLIDVSRFASAQLVASSVVVTMTSDCTTPGYNLISDMCVPCGKGLIYNSEQKQCDFCPMGTYKDMNDVECMPCGDEKTTVNVGTTTSSKCIDYCDAGRFYDGTVLVGSCQNCPRHYYQDKQGQSFCHPCAVGYKTQRDASKLASDCQADCQAGFDRNETGHCVMCQRGFWRDLIEDDCQPCDPLRTTIPGVIAKSRDLCEMDICEPGRFWDTTSEMCTDCPPGKFQDKEAMLECVACDGNKTTKNPRADSADLCTFYCAAGYEVNENETNACLPCKRGYYKDNEGNSKFETCKPCVGKTTDNIASESEDLCEYDSCPRGYYLVNKICIKCDVDYFQPMMMPDSSILCTHCPDIQGTPQGTEGDATEYETDCKPICPGGQQFDMTEMMCVDCDVGTFKPGDDRFGGCRNCPTNFTTDGKKKTADTDCDIPLCAEGDYVLDKVCTLCETDSFQPDLHPAAGVTCTPCPTRNGGVETGTRDSGADSEDKCEPVCPGGYEYRGDPDQCVKCPIGKYKPNTALDRFESCYNCTEGFINEEEGMTSVDSCNIRNCPPGSFDDDIKCEVCPYGFFQAEWTKKECDRCGDNLNTSRQGATSDDECQAFCGPGLQTTTSQTCEPCPEGKYKTAASYEPCKECPTDFTSNEGRTQCNIRFCSAGKENKTLATGTDCVPCEVGKFKANPGNTACETCPAGKTTNETQQTSCDILHCEPGKYRVGSSCVECATGYYKSEAGNDGCTMCPTGKTTPGQGSTNEDDCYIVVCGIGYYRVPTQTTKCTECAYDKYQHTVGQTFCNNCPIGTVTMQNASTSITDCVDECEKGQEYKNGACEACRQRYYKNTVDNFKPCEECPSKRTTVGTGSTDISQCNQADCDPGTYVHVDNGAVLCPKCAKGWYQPERSKTECISCGANRITVNEGSVLESQCHVRCPAGQGLFFPDTTTCVPCPMGQYKPLFPSNPNQCLRCPTGFTNSAPGKSTCTVPVVDPAPPVVIVTLVATILFGVETDCSESSLDVIVLNIQSQVRTGMRKQLGRYPGLCGINQSNNPCNNIFCTLRSGSCNPRRKRELTHNVEVIVTMPNVTDTVNDTAGNGSTLSTDNVVAEIFETNPADFTPLVGSIEYGSLTAPLEVTPVCEAGYYIDGAGCSPCATGQYWNSASATCLNCRTDEYQDEEAQTECKPCPENTYNDITAAKALSACKSFCTENPDYCNSRGDCRDTGRRTAECICNADFSGDRCETKQTPKSNNDAIIGGTVGGIAGLLVLILIVVGIYRWKFAGAEKKRHKKSSRHSHHSYEDEYFRNPIYDNRNGAGYYTPQGTVAGNMPAVFTSLPEAEYYAGNDPYALYSQSSKHKHHSRDHSETRQGGHPGGSEYIWQA